MDGERCDRAIARIEAAVARISAAAKGPQTGAHVGDPATLEARHRQLREAVTRSVAQLDNLIAGAGDE